MRISALLSAALLLATGSVVSAADDILLGVDNAGSPWLNLDSASANTPRVAAALHELGLNFMVYHLNPVTNQGSRGAEATAQRIQAIDDLMRRCGLRYMLNNETPNFVKTAEIDPGVNEFAHPDGTHRWDLRLNWLEQVLPPRKPGPPALIGITYDECEHMQLTCNQFAYYPDEKPFDAPFLVDTTGKDLETAYNRLVQQCKWIRLHHYAGRVRLSTEQVWPDMHHIFARAGWTITPKILKENLSSVVMAISLGAALEYQDTGTDWWVSPDLWCGGHYPGHSPEALHSALLMGYWLGASALYVENLDFGPYDQPHPLAPKKGSLITWNDDGSWSMTNLGEVVRDFYRQYVPAHPRPYTWRDYRPRVAIVRLPDGDWGQAGTAFRDRLLGNAQHPSDEISREWLQVWPILTHGVAHKEAISLNKGKPYDQYPWPFFVPIDSVAVFDHLVSGRVLDSVECFIVCGHALSKRTFEDIAGRVAKGATCIIARRLYSLYARTEWPGKWVVVDDFNDPAVAAALKPFLGPPDVARFRYRDRTVEFRNRGDGDRVEVVVRTR